MTYSLTVSLDGYTTDPDGGLGWGAPDDEVFALATDEVRGLGVHLLGRRLYETMRYWEDAERNPALDEAERDFAALWNALPKVVFSRTLTTVHGNARLATGTLAEEIARWRAEPGTGNIGIGGATLAAEAAAADLIDEYRVRVCPVLLGGGLPYFARQEQRVDLELLETRTFDSGVVFLHHRVVRQPPGKYLTMPS
ncbi:dihydrofolate reductase family protein [Mycobacterium sp. WMMD1722]|uniref:dihydrofolate reductase family protein n=1 Tax=Mycobacterium sp. WMMD1722 TaxID=3404117 RepID=UPI003BF46B97